MVVRKKVAVCYYGIASNIGNIENSNAPSLPVNYKTTYKNHMSNIIEENNADVFIHTWSSHMHDDLIKDFNPKYCIAEPQIDFTEEANKISNNPSMFGHFQRHHVLSRWYSTKKSIELKKKYEEETGVNYDYVILTRFDCIYNGDWNVSNLDSDKFYIAGGWSQNYNEEFPDLWFISNSENMDKLSMAYDNTSNVFFNNSFDSHESYWGSHLLSRRYLGYFDLLDKVKHFKIHKKDTDIVRG